MAVVVLTDFPRLRSVRDDGELVDRLPVDEDGDLFQDGGHVARVLVVEGRVAGGHALQRVEKVVHDLHEGQAELHLDPPLVHVLGVDVDPAVLGAEPDDLAAVFL